MLTNSIFSLAAAASVVNASPLLRRQATVTTESITSTAAVAVDTVTSTPGIEPTASLGVSNSGSIYPLYPCPPGFSLTYVQNNQTLERGLGEVKQQLGEWATAAIFPNVTAAMGGSAVNATHTYHALGADFLETLVDTTVNNTDSDFVQWVWNSTAAILAGQLEIATYSTVFKAYDPNFARLGYRSNETTIQLFTNACAANQTLARTTLNDLQTTQLNLINGTRVSDSTGTDGNGGVYITRVVATDTVSTTNTNTAIDTNTVVVTATNAVTQTNTLIPLTTTSTGATVQRTVTPITVSVTSTGTTVVSTADTTLVTASDLATATSVVATTTTSV